MGDSYSHEITIPLCQMDMVIELLKEAKEELKPTEFKPFTDEIMAAVDELREVAKDETE